MLFIRPITRIVLKGAKSHRGTKRLALKGVERGYLWLGVGRQSPEAVRVCIDEIMKT
jgi:hypothetical protein